MSPSNLAALPIPKPLPVTIDGNSYELIAFYYPGKNTAWDDIYNAPFFGNFWKCQVTITPPGQPSGTFHTAEAAFQATKWWQDPSIRKQFENAQDGNEAFHIRNHAGPQTNHNYAGFYRDGAMKAVLESKFSCLNPALEKALISTGSAYLLEHNSHNNRDSYWSDNCDGTGENKLGLALMHLRGALANLATNDSYPSPYKFTQEVQGRLPCRGH
ncbi:MAG: NADAR domain-containing protein [Akkermansiaceae bacterium]